MKLALFGQDIYYSG